MLPNGQIVSVGHSDSVERDVKVVAQSSAFADAVKVGLAQVWPERSALVAMDRKIQDSAGFKKSFKVEEPFSILFNSPRIIVKHPLRSLSVVDVPVDNQDPLQSTLIERMLRRNCHVVEEAVPIVLGLHGVVTRRPDDGHSVLHTPLQNCIDQLDRTTR